MVADGKISGIEELVTSKVSLDDVVEKGIMALLKEKDSQGKQCQPDIARMNLISLSQWKFLFIREGAAYSGFWHNYLYHSVRPVATK